MTILKGKCTNFGNCNHADHAQIFDIPLTGNTPVCPECGKEAIPITRKKIKPGHIAIIGGIVMLLLLVVKVLMTIVPMMFKPKINIEINPNISVSKPEVKPEPPKPESTKPKPESEPTVKAEQIIGFLEQGDFAQVREMIRKLPSSDNLIRKLDTPIRLTVKFQYQIKGQKPSELYPIESPQIQGITLTHEDNYRLEIEVPNLPEPVYLYVFRKDHYGKIYRRFPDPETYSMNLPDLKNPVHPGRTYSIPPGQNKYVYLDELPSDETRSIPETVYVIASPFDAKDVNAFFGKIHQETDMDTRNKLIAEFIQRVRSRETSGFASLFFREFVFYHAR